MEVIGFTCTKEEYIRKVNNLRIEQERLKISKKKRSETLVEIRIQPQFIVLNIPGAAEKLFCSTKGHGTFTLSLEHLYQILYSYPGEIISAKFKDNAMIMGEKTIQQSNLPAPEKVLFSPKSKNFQLPLRYNEFFILKVKDEILANEDSIPNAKILVENAELKMQNDLFKAFQILGFYNISYQEIEALILKNI